MAQTFEELKVWREHYRGALSRVRRGYNDTATYGKVLRELQRVERRMRVLKVREQHGASLSGLGRGDRRLVSRQHRRRTRL